MRTLLSVLLALDCCLWAASAAAEPVVLANGHLAASFDPQTGTLQSIENKLTGETCRIHGDEFCVETTDWRVDFRDARLVALKREPDSVEARYEHPRLQVDVVYTLGKDRHFLQKQIWLSCDRDCGLRRLILSRPEFAAEGFEIVTVRYPDFEPVTALVRAKHGWELRRPANTEPSRTFFGRTGKGGLFTGIEMPFDTSAAQGNMVVLGYAPSLKLKAGERLACEPMYLGVYRRSPRDLHADRWRPAAVGHNAALPLPCESEAMVAMTSAILGPPRHGLVALACGWHSQMQQDAYDSDEELAGDLKSLELLKACGLDGLTDSHPWGGETEKMNRLGDKDRYRLDARIRRFVQRANELGLMVTQWPTMNCTHPWNPAGKPFRTDRPEWLRGVEGKSVGGTNADNFRQRQANCLACTPFYGWLSRVVSDAMAEGLYRSWCMDGDFWGSGGYFNTTVPVTCLAANHDHLPGDSNYACQRALERLTASVRQAHPSTYILMCRPPMDLGVWSQRNVDACFTLIESGTGGSNVAAGDEIRTASRIRVHHHYFPHWLDQALLFPSYGDPSLKSVPPWPSEKLDYILLSALSCSPNLLMYLPTKTGIPERDQAEIRKWLEWGRANVHYLKVRKDLFDWPQPGKVDGSAHVVGDQGLVFLFNPSKQTLPASFDLTEAEVGLPGPGRFRIAQEHPAAEKSLVADHGQTVPWQIPPESAVVLRVQPAGNSDSSKAPPKPAPVFRIQDRSQEAVLKSDKPWESLCVNGATVLREGGRWRMWYGAYDRTYKRDDDAVLCYAESADGVHWTKPDLGFVEYQGNKQNNILVSGWQTGGFAFSYVFRDETRGADERYKMIFQRFNEPQQAWWVYGGVSADAVHWSLLPKPLSPKNSDTTTTCLVDGGKYRLYTRIWRGGWSGVRTVGYTESDHFGDFPDPVEIFSHDGDDPPGMQFYSNAATKLGDQLYVMFPAAFYTKNETVRSHLAWSRDGVHFTRVGRQPVVDLGKSFDKMGVYVMPGATPADAPNRWWFYYTGVPIGHDTGDLDHARDGGIGRFMLVVE